VEKYTPLKKASSVTFVSGRQNRPLGRWGKTVSLF